MGDVPCKISILTAMEMVHKAWENVGAQTIVNCFRTCGFIKDGQKIGESIPVQCEEVEVLLSTWNRLEVPVSFEEFVHFDDNVATAGNFTDEEIIQSTSVNQHNSDNDDEEEEAEVPAISLKEAKFFMSGLRQFFEQSEMDEKRCDTIFNAINKLDNAMDQIATNNFSQKKITDFFNIPTPDISINAQPVQQSVIQYASRITRPIPQGYVEIAPQIFVPDIPTGGSNMLSEDEICMTAMDEYEKQDDNTG
ncbi:hypothetical protein QTP88_005090 [Uroleucon formosanum]